MGGRFFLGGEKLTPLALLNNNNSYNENLSSNDAYITTTKCKYLCQGLKSVSKILILNISLYRILKLQKFKTGN